MIIIHSVLINPVSSPGDITVVSHHPSISTCCYLGFSGRGDLEQDVIAARRHRDYLAVSFSAMGSLVYVPNSYGWMFCHSSSSPHRRETIIPFFRGYFL